MNSRPQLKHAQIKKALRLLNMLYKPAELAEELQTTADTIVRTWIPAGLPVQTDARGHRWINGKECAEWVTAQRTRKPQRKYAMKDNEALCMGCKKVMPLTNPEIKQINRHAEMLKAPCPKCKRIIYRIRGNRTFMKFKGQK